MLYRWKFVQLAKCADALIMKGVVFMKNFVVTYRSGCDETVNCAIMTGNQLTNMYGFSDCTGDEILRVWEVYDDGDLVPCEFWSACYAPYNVLYVHRLGNYEPYEYEWPEH